MEIEDVVEGSEIDLEEHELPTCSYTIIGNLVQVFVFDYWQLM